MALRAVDLRLACGEDAVGVLRVQPDGQAPLRLRDGRAADVERMTTDGELGLADVELDVLHCHDGIAGAWTQ